MDYCIYHPLAPATYSCSFCHTHNCDHCADEGDGAGDVSCFSCKQPLEHLGAVNVATPFWRRLQESFRYPLNGNALTLVIVVSVLSLVALQLPFALLWTVILSGAFLKYSFSCLEKTAAGLLVAPDITEAYSGGLLVMFHLFVMLAAAIGSVVAAGYYVGFQAAAVLGVLLIFACPAVIIIYGLTGSLFEAMNPLSIARLIASVGLPYGLLLAFGMIMSASVSVISQVIGEQLTTISLLLQSIVANYYTIVMFHIMGYMIFQYQGSLGFTAREDTGEDDNIRSDRDRLEANIRIRLKEGDYNQVVALFNQALRQFPIDREFNRQYFEFFYATKRNLPKAASRYLQYLCESGQEHLLMMVYKRVLLLVPDYLPDEAPLRHHLAAVCWENGDPRSTVRLINGMHKPYPDYPELAEAYELMADALEDLPNHHQQAVKCRQFAQRLAQLQAKRTKERAAAAPQPRRHPVRIPPADPATPAEPTQPSDKGDLPPIEFV